MLRADFVWLGHMKKKLVSSANLNVIPYQILFISTQWFGRRVWWITGYSFCGC